MTKCNCQGNTCSCLIQAQDNAVVTGTGTKADPYLISFDINNFSINENLQLIDTSTIAWTNVGSGSPADPLLARAAIALVAPNGSKWGPSVSNAGAVTWAEL